MLLLPLAFKFFTLHSSFFTYLRVAFDANAPPTLSHPLYIINGNYLELVPIHLGLKGQLNLAQGNTLGVRITLHSSALTGQLHKCIVFQSICQTQMLNIFYVAALSGRKVSGVIHRTQGVASKMRSSAAFGIAQASLALLSFARTSSLG